MLEKELLAVLALQKAKGIGDIIAKKLITQCGSASQVFKEKTTVLSKINNVGEFTIQSLKDKALFLKAEQELKYIQKTNTTHAFYLDHNYPKLLKHCIDGPILIFNDGKIDLENKRIISIVGTRKMTLNGRDFINQLIKDLAPYNPIVVSGFAYGVDITAQKSAMENNLQTIGVLAHGLDEIYPKSHKKYIHKVNSNGGFITEFWHDEQPLRENFLKRNRIVAGISQATIIIESAVKGGSLVTADIANSYNRDVFAVPGRPTDGMSKGCNSLIKQHKAGLITSADDLVKALNWDITSKKEQPKQKLLFVELSEEEQKVTTFLQENGKSYLDDIALQCGIPVYKLATILFNLEMKNLVKAQQGKMFEAVN